MNYVIASFYKQWNDGKLIYVDYLYFEKGILSGKGIASNFSSNLLMTVYHYWMWHKRKSSKRWFSLPAEKNCLKLICIGSQWAIIKSCSSCLGQISSDLKAYQLRFSLLCKGICFRALDGRDQVPCNWILSFWPTGLPILLSVYCLDAFLAMLEESLPNWLWNAAPCWQLQWLLVSVKIIRAGCSSSAEQQISTESYNLFLVNSSNLQVILDFFWFLQEVPKTLANYSSLTLITGTLLMLLPAANES